MRRRWADGAIVSIRDSAAASDAAAPAPDDRDPDRWFLQHLTTCSACRDEARELYRLDRALTRGFAGIRACLHGPSQEQVDETLRRLREEPEEIRLIRRIRRPLRILLWISFYLFTLLAVSVLAAALYKALKELVP